MSDRVFATVCLGVCAVILYQMWNLEVPFAYEPIGPKAFPMLLAVLMGVCCVAMLMSPDRDIRWPQKPVLAKGAILLAVFLVYALLFEKLGFPILTVAMVIAVSRLFGARWLSGLVAGLSIGICGYLIFNNLLQVSLPLGRIWS